MRTQRGWRFPSTKALVMSCRTAVAAALALAAGSARFWSLRLKMLRFQFGIQHLVFRLSDTALAIKRQRPTFTAFASVAVAGITTALFAAALTITGDSLLHVAHPALISLGFRLPGPEQGFINTADAAILQLSVVIIGLYAAAFSIVASTVYGHIYGDIRELL